MMNKEEHELAMAYRNVFESRNGQLVFADMLVRLHFFDNVSTDEAVALRAFAVWMLSTMGIFHPQNYEEIVKRMIGISTIHPSKKET